MEPGETLSGRLSLDRQFPTFAKDLGNSGVIVFWSYQLMPLACSPFARAAGYVLFNRTVSE
jgi:hypothetical protein